MGENISNDFSRGLTSTTHGSNLLICGGCYHSDYIEAGTDTHVTLCSGSYQYFMGGSNNRACASGNIKIEVLGDVVFKKYFACGSYNANCGDIDFTLNGVLSVGEGFSIGAYGTGETANSATFHLESGRIFTESFPALPNDPIPNRPFGTYRAITTSQPNPQTFGEMLASNGALTIFYNPSDSSSAATANAFRFSRAAEGYNILWKLIGDQSWCMSNNDGAHNPDPAWDHVGYTDVESTCAEQGMRWYKCADCGEVYFVAEDPVPHAYDAAQIAVEKNCTTPNIYEHICSECGHIERYIDEADAELGGHRYENNVCVYCNAANDCAHENLGEAVVTDYGCGTTSTRVCEDCGAEVVEYITTSAHSFGKYTITVAPTETTPGVKTRKCSKCGKVETASVYSESGYSEDALAVDSNGALVDIDSLKLSKAEKAALNALLQDTEYGSEVKVSYQTKGNVVTGVTYSIPVPAEYKDMQNVKIVVKDDNGELHTVAFTIEKGYFVFNF